MTWNRTYIDGPLLIPILGPADPETGEREVLGHVPGYHLNVARRIMTTALAAYEVDPEPHTPLVTWSGDERGEDGRYQLTAFLRFTDEAEALTVLAAWAI